MYKGKEICDRLTTIRQQIADANGIAYAPTPCNHKGECTGTCPKCEAESRYLSQQLSAKKQAGYSIQIIGLAAGLSSLAACSQPIEMAKPVENSTSIESVWSDELPGDIAIPSDPIEELYQDTAESFTIIEKGDTVKYSMTSEYNPSKKE